MSTENVTELDFEFVLPVKVRITSADGTVSWHRLVDELDSSLDTTTPYEDESMIFVFSPGAVFEVVRFYRALGYTVEVVECPQADLRRLLR